jgi:hydrogenase expression/formation protein HypD
MGYEEYYPIAGKYKVPVVVTGFEPLDILQGIYMCIRQLEEGRAEVENQYSRVVEKEGNRFAQDIIKKVFKITNRKWRGIGEISQSGLTLQDEYAEYDAEKKFNLTEIIVNEPKECISGLILQGLKKPFECGAFGKVCNPEHPLGATMVSTEGACAAYYRYRNKTKHLE